MATYDGPPASPTPHIGAAIAYGLEGAFFAASVVFGFEHASVLAALLACAVIGVTLALRGQPRGAFIAMCVYSAIGIAYAAGHDHITALALANVCAVGAVAHGVVAVRRVDGNHERHGGTWR